MNRRILIALAAVTAALAFAVPCGVSAQDGPAAGNQKELLNTIEKRQGVAAEEHPDNYVPEEESIEVNKEKERDGEMKDEEVEEQATMDSVVVIP